MLNIPFMSVTHFSRLTNMGVKQIKARMDIGEIPEVLHRKEGAVRYVDLVELVHRMEAGQFEFSDLTAQEKNA